MEYSKEYGSSERREGTGIFGIPKELEELFFMQGVVFYLIAFLLMSYADGRVTIMYIENEFGLSGYNDTIVDEKDRLLSKYNYDLKTSNRRVSIMLIILYFVISPVINFYYGYKHYKKRKIYKRENV